MNERDSASDDARPLNLVEFARLVKDGRHVSDSDFLALKDMARTLHGVIKAAVAANLQIDDDMLPEVSQLVRNAVDGLLEAAEIMAKGLACDLDMRAPEVAQ